MDAIICSAGKGTRLGALGLYMRKSMFRDIHTDKSILWHQLDALHAISIESVVVVHPVADWQIPAEVARLHDRHPGMKVRCVAADTANILQTIIVALRHTDAARILRLDGDVCVIERDGLANVRDYPRNALCCCEPADGGDISEGAPIFDGRQIRFYRAGVPPAPLWTCIDVWQRDALDRVLRGAQDDSHALFCEQVNRELAASPGLDLDTLMAPTVYEIDTPADVAELERAWDRNARLLEERSLEFWTAQQAYPRFSVDKQAQLRIDEDLVVEFCRPGDSVLEVGAGPGSMVDPLLHRGRAACCAVVEPNPHWCRGITARYAGDSRVSVFCGTLAAWNASEPARRLSVATALAFGWSTYIIHDESLHQNLVRLRARRLLLKAAEPPQDRFSRLLVNHSSRELGTHYIALYRSVGEMCSLLRHAGWCVREIRREIYPESIDSAYGNRAYLLVAERP